VVSQRATRLWGVLGVAVGSMVLFAAYAFASKLAPVPASWAWIGSGFQFSLGGSLILMLVVSLLGAPLRAEDEYRDAEYDLLEDEG
jgi:predicted phage tail protein